MNREKKTMQAILTTLGIFMTGGVLFASPVKTKAAYESPKQTEIAKEEPETIPDGYIPEFTKELEEIDYEREEAPWLLEAKRIKEEEYKKEQKMIKMVAQLVQAEAGNQGLKGMRLVADVILNRVDSNRFPNTIEKVMWQKGQFTPMRNGAYKKAGKNLSKEAIKAVTLEWNKEDRLDQNILYFGTTKANGKGFWKYKSHWFSY